MICEIRWCKKEVDSLYTVTENIGDGAFAVNICSDCLKKLGIKPGDDLPSPDSIYQVLRMHGGI